MIIVGTQYELAVDNLATEFLKRFFSKLEGDERILEIKSKTENNHWQGITLMSWKIPDISSTSDKTYITFRLDENGSILITDISITYTLGGTEVTLIAHPNESQSLLFQTSPNTDTKSIYPDLKGHLQVFQTSTTSYFPEFVQLDSYVYYVQLDIADQISARHEWVASQESFELSSGYWGEKSFPLKNLQFHHSFNQAKSGFSSQSTFSLRGEIELGKTCQLSLTPNFNNNFRLDISSKEGLPNLMDMAEMLEMNGIGEAMQTLYSEIKQLNDLVIESIRLGVNISQLKITSVELMGHVSISGYKFLFSIHFPQFHFFTRLSPETSIPLGRIFHDHFPTGLGLPSGLNISQLALSAQLDPKRFGIIVTISDLWQFSLGPTSFHLEKLQFELRKTLDEQAEGSLRAQMQIGTLDLTLFARNSASDISSGWLLQTQMAHEASISLNQLVTELAHLFHFTMPPEIPEVAIHDLDLSFNTASHDFSIHGRATLESDLGPIKKGAIEISVELTKSEEARGHQITINIHGEFNISNTLLEFTAEVGHPDWTLSIDWQKGFGQAIPLLGIAKLVDPSIEFPQGLEEALSISQINFNYKNNTNTFQASVTTEGGESIALVASGQDQNKGFILGVGYQKPENLPQHDDGLLKDGLKKVTEVIELENLWFLINTFENTASRSQLPSNFQHELDTTTLKKGFAVMATLKLDSDHGHNGLKQLKEHLPVAELTFMAIASENEAGTKGVLLRASLGGQVNIPTGQGNHLILEDCYLEFSWYGEHIGLKLHGTVHFTLDHVPITTSVGLEVDQNGAKVQMSLVFDEGWKFFGLDNVILDELDLLIGVEFEPPGVELGLQGAMHLMDQNQGDKAEENNNKLGVMLEFVGEIPNPEYFALSIGKIDLNQIVSMFAGSSAHGNQKVSSTLNAHYLSVYWAERALTLPDGTTARSGFGLHGEFDIFGWKAYAHLDAHTDSGISGHAETAPIDWHILKLSGNGQGVYAQEYWNSEKEQWERISNTNSPLPPQTRLRTVELVPPGGPMIHFDSNHSPFISASIHAQLFGLVSSELDLEVTDSGFSFNLHFEVPHITNLRLACDLKNGTSFTASGQFFAGLDFNIETAFGNLEIELGVDARMDIAIGQTISEFVLALEGGIDVMGVNVPFARINMSNPPQRLEQIPLWLGMHFAESVFPPLHDLFQDAYDEMNKLPEPFDQAKYDQAIKLRNLAREWAAFVHADILEIQQENGLPYDQISERAAIIEEQAAQIKAQGLSHVREVKGNNAKETSSMQAQSNRLNERAVSKRNESNAQRQIRINRMLREIMDLTDDGNTLRNQVEKVWDQYQSDWEQAERAIKEVLDLQASDNSISPELLNQSYESHKRIENNIKSALDNLRLDTPPDKEYPNIEGKYTAIAVDHFMSIVKANRISAIQESNILQEARKQARAIINRAHSDVHSISVITTNS